MVCVLTDHHRDKKMKKIINPDKKQWLSLCERPAEDIEDLSKSVQQIFQEIKQNGDAAVAKYTEIFDGVRLDNTEVSEGEIAGVVNKVAEELKEAIALAKQNIEKFHASQKLTKEVIETSQGVLCWQETRPIEKIGIYIPGGTAPLFSTVLMLAVPAKITGCKEIVLCTPPNKEGKINPAILYTANLIGIDKIYKIGGIQAIGAMTIGTETVPKVYKIFGPGNQYVTAAKQQAMLEGIAIDMPAGPSELLVLADDTANPAFVASDLLSQAEHGADSQVICIVNDEKLMYQVEREVEKQISVLPRKDVAEKAIRNSKLILIEDKQKAIDLINEYAPEHFILAVKEEGFYLENLVNAGSVFIGNYTPESAGDYASGTNHTLPTNGFAKSYSGVNLDSFSKKITFQKISTKGIKNIGGAIEIMAAAEGLQAHKNAVTLRLENLGKE